MSARRRGAVPDRSGDGGGDAAGRVVDWDLSGSRLELFLNCLPGRLGTPHRHRHFELLFILKGRRGLRMGGRGYVAGPGDVMIFRPGDVHEEFPRSKRISYIVLRFSAEELARAGAAFPDTSGLGPVFSLPDRERFERLFNRMVLECRGTEPDAQLLLGAYITEFVVLFGRAARKLAAAGARGGSSGPDRVLAAAELIRGNLGRELRLDELARASFMSLSHFAHRFREEVGAPPRRFMIAERIERARRLLAATDRSAQDISRELGYESPYFFYRQFRQKTGMTTGEFRRRSRPAGR